MYPTTQVSCFERRRNVAFRTKRILNLRYISTCTFLRSLNMLRAQAAIPARCRYTLNYINIYIYMKYIYICVAQYNRKEERKKRNKKKKKWILTEPLGSSHNRARAKARFEDCFLWLPWGHDTKQRGGWCLDTLLHKKKGRKRNKRTRQIVCCEKF